MLLFLISQSLGSASKFYCSELNLHTKLIQYPGRLEENNTINMRSELSAPFWKIELIIQKVNGVFHVYAFHELCNEDNFITAYHYQW